MIIDRRQCMQCLWGSVLALHSWPSRDTWAHETSLRTASDDTRPSLANPATVKLKEIHLRCDNIDRVESFYADALEIPVRRVDQDILEINIGQSKLCFSSAEAQSHPFYHFAINISKNKFAEAKRWVSERTRIVVAPDGRDQFHFTSRDADACYFLDPAGNLVEFIAHQRLSNERRGRFGVEDLHDVCEIGVVVSDLRNSLAEVKTQINARPYAPPFADEFAAVGDERGFLIMVKEDRLWYPRRARTAKAYSTNIVLQGSPTKSFELADAKTTFSISE